MDQINSPKETTPNSGSSEKKQEAKETKKEKHMPFTDHLEELRMRLFKVIGSIVGSGLICYIFKFQILGECFLPRLGKNPGKRIHFPIFSFLHRSPLPQYLLEQVHLYYHTFA